MFLTNCLQAISAMSAASQRLLQLGAAPRAALLNPIVTGPLLWALAVAPNAIQGPLLQQLDRLPLDNATVVTALKVLFGLGIANTLNSLLNSMATNGWSLTSDSSRWNWSQELAVVTGGCSGIGELVVKGLADKGIRIAVLDVQPLPQRLKGYNIHFQTCDITDPTAVHNAAETIRSKVGHPTILINNAGIGSAHTIVDTTPRQLQKIFGVNLLSHWYTVGEFLPAMIKQDKGHIVTVASMASFVACPSIADYAATKAGALAFHEALTQELRHRHAAPHVHTTVVHPNWTRTPLVADHAAHIEKHQGPLLTPDVVAAGMVKQVLSCRGGQLFYPEFLSSVSGIRGFPHWLQERIRDGIGKLGTGA
ncbi:hypothetical protein IWZ00DRAFT_519081 [Phyllosticta capitalensis]|uniref:Uncharacterized protein n=1 Tax=Phyllosticta capitalensis TaxID=121624 RepID=A0ABR1YE80_9PEZI